MLKKKRTTLEGGKGISFGESEMKPYRLNGRNSERELSNNSFYSNELMFLTPDYCSTDDLLTSRPPYMSHYATFALLSTGSTSLTSPGHVLK